MDTDLDTFLVAVYTVVDTLYQTEIAPQRPIRSGPAATMSDSEVLTLTIIGHWRGSSERALLRWADTALRAWFPVQLSQSAFNRRVRALGAVLARVMVALATMLGAEQAPYHLVDTVPLPLARQCRGRRRRLFTAAEADIGYGGSDRTFFYGCRLLVVAAAAGPVTGFVLAPASTQDRWQLEAALTWRCDPAAAPRPPEALPPAHAKGGTRAGPAGPCWWPGSVGGAAGGPLLGDNGFGGEAWQPYWQTALATTVVTPADIAATPADRRRFSALRQAIETVTGVLTEALHLPFPLAKTDWGLVTRVAAKCAALNLGIWVNRWLGRPDLRLTTLFPG